MKRYELHGLVPGGEFELIDESAEMIDLAPAVKSHRSSYAGMEVLDTQTNTVVKAWCRQTQQEIDTLRTHLAAHKLAEACRGLLDAIHDSMTHESQQFHAAQITAARAAIAKATGGGE